MIRSICKTTLALSILTGGLFYENSTPNTIKTVEAATINGTVTATVLNMRSGPGTSYKIVGTLKKGNSVTITGTSGNWFKITSGTKSGWVSSSYIKKSPNTVSVATVNKMKTLGTSKQLIIVSADNESTRNVLIETFEKSATGWKKLHTYSGVIGKNGMISNKHEGDYETPEGKYTITTAFGRYTNPGTKLTYRKITSDDVWVDDSNSKLYNTWQLASQNNGRWKSAENMNRSLYDYGFVINYNEAKVPGKGSAIFFHIAGTSGYTAGCTATSRTYVVSILKWLDPSKKPIIIQTPFNKLSQY
ncbi:SH3 domain-containing protein [Gottfriedia luciferensis]|uniref:SH3 domain-containing protein n=1 Tax=Gottfriedia luciferensis TaxID=178774 RepID=UPI0011552019|nr:SH3 domain-containing protein [Gottfriedia luciferensis]